MSNDRERIIEFEASTSIPADGWLAIDSTTEGTRKIQKSAIIGSGSLDTTSQEVIGAINEVNQRAATIDSMTQDEYNDLPSTKESDNVPRFITDGVPTFDETLWNKVGTDPLDTTAQDCSGAINEIKQSLSDLIQYVLIQGTTSSSGALALPSAVVNGAILDMYYEGAGVNGFINRRDKNYLTCYDNNLNIKASTAVKIHCYYTPISQS